MPIKKIVKKDGTVLMDLTQDTVVPEALPIGVTAHDKNGDVIFGTVDMEKVESIKTKIDLENYDSFIDDFNTYLSTKTINIKDSEVDEYAFAHNTNITDVRGDNVLNIKSNAFESTGLKKASFSKCKKIGSMAFLNATRLKEIKIPNCKVIEPYAFYLTNLKDINIPNCKKIGSYAFARNKH